MGTRPPPPPAADGPPLLGQTVPFARDPLAAVGDCADAHGSVFRMQVLGLGEFYVLAAPAHVERALVTDQDAFGKNEDFRIAFGESVVSTGGAQWQRQRGVLNEFFTPARIDEYTDRMVALTARHLEGWADGDRVALAEVMRTVALDNFLGTVFDRPLDPDGDAALQRAANDLNLWFNPTSFALPQWVPTPSRRRFRRARATIAREAERLLTERRAGDGDDLLSTLVELRAGADTALSDDEIVDQVIGLIFAGHDTTALTMTYALHQLATHDDVRKRVHAELDDVLDGTEPTLADVGELETIERVLQETLRAYPALHTIPRETTQPVEVDGYRLAPDTRTHLAVWEVHHDETHWEDPDSWRPARWCDTTPDEEGYAYVPFGAGPRLCLGRRFAMLEATLVVAMVCQEYRLEAHGELSFAPMTTTQPADDVPVTVHRR